MGDDKNDDCDDAFSVVLTKVLQQWDNVFICLHAVTALCKRKGRMFIVGRSLILRKVSLSKFDFVCTAGRF